MAKLLTLIWCLLVIDLMNGGFTFVLSTGPLLFDPQYHGPKLDILDNGTLAQRYEGGCYAVGLSNRPLRVGEKMNFEIAEIESGWIGNLNVGIIYTAPIDIRDLVTCDPNVSKSLNHTKVFIFDKFYSSDNRYTFQIDGKGAAYLTPNVTATGEVFRGVDVTRPFWAIFNIFGQTKAVRLFQYDVIPE